VIPGLPQVGPLELVILLSIVLLFFGAKRIPELARALGKGTREFRKSASEPYLAEKRSCPSVRLTRTMSVSTSPLGDAASGPRARLP